MSEGWGEEDEEEEGLQGRVGGNEAGKVGRVRSLGVVLKALGAPQRSEVQKPVRFDSQRKLSHWLLQRTLLQGELIQCVSQES